ncbi:MAG: ABC transporter ATP-binding protein [Roseibacillus sp.]|nr:ABC transporter ATP-binding protein [Roseibacillus sp.]HAO96403.1 ABC transporter ATP-binding protein [Verrucomicrobiales bacterium]|tara:strand:- start:12060 stop:12830 length:771 start_codon:yes stop_codon:yes gene_type:complete
MMETVFELSQARKSFGAVHALSSIDLQIARGERVALIGASGSGKTTLLRLFGAQLAPDRGEVRVLGCNPLVLGERKLRELRSRLGYLPQDLGLVPNLRVLQNVVAGRCGRRSILGSLRDLILPAVGVRRRIYELLERVGIAEKMYDRADTLSGGQQQRVAVARALFQEPAVILADEPVSAVDPARARDVLELLTRLSEEEGLTLLVSMHQLDLAREFFPRLVGLKHGNVHFDGKPSELGSEGLSALFDLGDKAVVL